MLSKVYEDIKNGELLSREEALKLMDTYSWEELSPICNRLREDKFGNKVLFCTIINAKSGSCDMDCKFCSQNSQSKTGNKSYPLVPSEEIEKAVIYSHDNRAQNCGIVSCGGKLNRADINRLSHDIETIKEKHKPDICASFGRLGFDELAQLKKAGFSRIHHNLESSEKFYPEFCSTQSWQDRLKTVKKAQAMGFKVCCGGLFGLGESWENRIALALTLRELGIKSIPINFLHPQKGTAFESRKKLLPQEALKIICLYRLLLPEATLRICGGRTAILEEKQSLIFRAGANAIMTGDYLTTSGGSPDKDILMIEKQGLRVI